MTATPMRLPFSAAERKATWTSQRFGGSSTRRRCEQASTRMYQHTGFVTPTQAMRWTEAVRYTLFKRLWDIHRFRQPGDTCTLDQLNQVEAIYRRQHDRCNSPNLYLHFCSLAAESVSNKASRSLIAYPVSISTQRY